MYTIKDFEILGFWNHNRVYSKINNDINIFIGKNGTGKTTLINLLQAALTVDIDLLYALQYDTIIINLVDNRKRKKIEINKITDELNYSIIEYKIGTSKYKLPVISYREIISRRNKSLRYNSKFYIAIKAIQEKIKELINITYLSVYRESLFNDETFSESRRELISNTIDFKLENLIKQLITYQLQLETVLSKLSKTFQENVLRTMLFNEELDFVNIDEPIKLSIDEIKSGLEHAYKELGILDNKTKKTIEKHVKAISKAADAINKHVKDNSNALYVNDVTPLTILKRTRKIIKLSSKLEDEKDEIFEPLNDYLRIINEFSDTKKFEIDKNNNEGIIIKKGVDIIPMNKLSSGEKQLIILLTETLLQKKTKTIYIADEPELSLHIEWQRKILPSIKKLNPNAQIIIATHSPEIVGKWTNKTINMEKIINKF